MALKTICVRIEESQVKWLDMKAKRNDFASRAHGVRYCLQHVMDESRDEETLAPPFMKQFSQTADKLLGIDIKEARGKG